MEKEKLDKFHYHEFIDRCSVIQDIIETHLRNHPIVDTLVIKDIDRVQYILSELYNYINDKKEKLKDK